MDVCTTPGMVFYNKGPEAKKLKKKFSQADIDAKVKLAVEKKQLRTQKSSQGQI